MRAFRLVAILMACTLVAFSSTTLFAFALNFTSGLPPVGDFEDYPRSLNPARQAPGGGASPGSFFSTIGVSFNNLNGNPAYFDANNLLTRPATLINNEAFWTDPKFGQFSSGGGGTFELAHFGFDFIPGFTDGLDFGFDLAMASVSTDLPTGSFFDEQTGNFITAPFLPFQIQDDNFNTARGTLVFASGASSGPEEGAIFAETVGTFNTLGSPRTAYEARFRIDQSFLQGLIEYENDLFGGDPGGDPEEDPGDGGFVSGPIQFFDIDLANITTFGGTTQIAMDNFVLGGTPAINDPLREPLTFSPFDPVGANTPQYFVTDDSSGDPFEGITDGIFEALDVATSAADGEFDVSILGNPTPTGSQTTGVTATVPSDSNLRTNPVDPMAGIVIEYDESQDPSTFVPEEEVPLGGIIEVNTVSSTGDSTTGQYIVEATNETSNLIMETTSQISNAIQSAANQILQDNGIDPNSTDPDANLPLSEADIRSLLESSFGEAEDFFQIPISNETVGDIIQSIGAKAFTEGSLFGDSGLDGLGNDVIGDDVPSSINQIGNTVELFSEEVTHAILNAANNQLSGQAQSILEVSSGAEEAATQAILRIRETASGIGNLQLITAGDFIAQVEALVTGSTFINYSYSEYLQYLTENGLTPTVGDTGGFTEPIFDASGEIVDFRFHSWIITDQSGSFASSLTLSSEIPEPSSALILLMLLGISAIKART